MRSRRAARPRSAPNPGGSPPARRRARPRWLDDTEPVAPRSCSRNQRSASNPPGLKVPCGRLSDTGNCQCSPGRGSATVAAMSSSTLLSIHQANQSLGGRPATGCPARSCADVTRNANCTPCRARRGRPSISPCTNSGTPSRVWGSRCCRRSTVRSAVLPCATNPIAMAKSASWAHKAGPQRKRPPCRSAPQVHGCPGSPGPRLLRSAHLARTARTARTAQTAQSEPKPKPKPKAKPNPNIAHNTAVRGRLGHADSRATPITQATTAVTPLATHRCATSETCFTRSM
jgi:hypothetical protein